MNDDRVIVIGYGLIALCSAAAIAERGMKVTLIGEIREGEASPAAAGMLAPGVEPSAGAAHDFAVAARDRYVTFLDWVESATGARIPLDRNGILQLAQSPGEADSLQRERAPGTKWLEPPRLHELEPALAATHGALYHEFDGAVDNAALTEALRAFASRAASITVVMERAVALDSSVGAPSVRCASGRQYSGSTVVIAAGAWSAELAGLPTAIPVHPMRGQMLAVAGAPLRHVAFAGHGYIVPRSDGTTFIGSTSEHTGFDNATTSEAADHLRALAAALCPTLGAAPTLRHWAGLRPMTPDFLPVIGRDARVPSVIYALGHSRNGILMAPLTGDCVAALVDGQDPGCDLRPFAPARF
jgi:glycine oxidase